MQYSYGVTAAISFVEWNCYDYIHSNTSIQPSRFSAGYIYAPHLRVFRQASVSQRRNRKLSRIQGRTFLTIWALVTGANCFLPFSSFYSSTVDSQISSSEYLFATEFIAYDLIISLEWEEKLFVLRRQSINHNWGIQRRTFVAGNSVLRYIRWQCSLPRRRISFLMFHEGKKYWNKKRGDSKFHVIFSNFLCPSLFLPCYRAYTQRTKAWEIVRKFPVEGGWFPDDTARTAASSQVLRFLLEKHEIYDLCLFRFERLAFHREGNFREIAVIAAFEPLEGDPVS